MTKNLDKNNSDEWGNIELPGIEDDKLYNTNWNLVYAQRELRKDPNFNKKVSDGLKAMWAKAETKETASKNRKARWQDPAYSEPLRQKRKETAQDPEYKKRLSEGHRRSLESPELRKKLSEASKKAWADPDTKKKASESIKKNWQDPDFRNKMSNRRRRPGKSIHTPWGNYDSRVDAIAAAKLQGIKNSGNKIDIGLKTDPINFYVLN